jgi:hypothetical protein
MENQGELLWQKPNKQLMASKAKTGKLPALWVIEFTQLQRNQSTTTALTSGPQWNRAGLKHLTMVL